MTEKRKRHFKVGEVKALILEIVLENKGSIKESDVQIVLKDKFESFDQSTINRHLRYLNEHGCIEKIPQVDKSRSYWDVINFDQLKNIRSEFKFIKLNNYEKIIRLVLLENGYDVEHLHGFFIYFQLLLSDSFFQAVLGTSVETLRHRVGNLYIYKRAHHARLISDWFAESFSTYDNHPSTIKISKEEFYLTVNKLLDEGEKISTVEILIEKWNEKINKISKEPPVEFNKLVEEEDLMLFNQILRAMTLNRDLEKGAENSFFSLLFEAYFLQDVLLDVASREERDFAVGTKASSDEFNASFSYIKDNTPYYRKMILSDLGEVSKLMKTHKHPSLFDKKIYDNETDIRMYLEEHFDKEIQEISKSINYLTN
jgi:Fe2+ or Zn2+ uptake regulation protein